MLSGNLTYDKIYSKVCQDQKKGFGVDILKTKITYDFKAPIVSSVVVGGGTLTDNELRIYFDEAINLLSPPIEEDFSVSFSGGDTIVASLMVYEDNGDYFVNIYLDRAIETGETGSVTYIGTALEDILGNKVLPFTKSIKNNI